MAIYQVMNSTIRGLALALAIAVTPQAAPAQGYTFFTLAGANTAPGTADGTGSAARFNTPLGVAADSAGNLCVADTGNNLIRKVTPDGAVTTLAGLEGSWASFDGTGAEAWFLNPSGVAVDRSGNWYVADNCAIRKITPGGVVTTLAGLAGVQGSADGTATAARFSSLSWPNGLVVDASGNVYVADCGNCTIRKVTPQGAVTTLAGLAGSLGSADGTGSAARFSFPQGLAVDRAGNLYVADYRNDTLRKVRPDGVVTTLAGLAGIAGSDDGAGSVARFNQPTGVAVDSTGTVYVAEMLNATIRKVTPAGVVTTLAGRAGALGIDDGTGSAARFMGPQGIAADGAGNLYVLDTCSIRKVTPQGAVTTLAGAGLPSKAGSADGAGNAARFNSPMGVAVDGAGNVFVADTLNDTIRKVTPRGVVTTAAGVAGWPGANDGPASLARFNNPQAVAVDSAGNVFVADTLNDTIRKVTPGGMVTTVAGVALAPGTNDGPASVARFNHPSALLVDPSGNLFVEDTGNNTVRKITPDGVVTTLAGGAPFAFSQGQAVDTAGKLYVVDTANCAIVVGFLPCPDVATIDFPIGVVGQARQLESDGQTAVAWGWRLIRQPAASAASLSAPNIRNPTFTPDVPDLYVFQVEATNAAGQVGLRTLDFRAVPDASTPCLLATVHLAASISGAVLTNSFNLAIGFEEPSAGLGTLLAPLFDNLTFRAADVGRSFNIGPGDDPAFPAFVALLTDGLPYSFCCDLNAAGGSSLPCFPKPSFYLGLPADNDGGDLDGFDIDHVSLRFDAIDLVSPGQNPRGDGIWTDCSISAAFCVYGWPLLPATIRLAPTNQTVIQGAGTLFSVLASGCQPLSYQWFFNGTNPLPGATNSGLGLTNIQVSQSGAYTVVVTNVFGAATSPPAFLTVIGVPPGATAVDYCTEEALRTALAAGGRVVFLFDGTINVASTVAVTSNALLDGNGHQVTIGGGNQVGVFAVPAGVTFGLTALTIANGLSSAGGAVRNDGGALNATNCVFYNNSASGTAGANATGGAIYNSGTFNASRCVFYDNAAWGANGTSNYVSGDGSGGAIYNAGSLEATQCGFGWNHAQGGNAPSQQGWGYGTPGGTGQGGAICNAGTMVLASSLLASNWVSGGNGSIGYSGERQFGPGDGGFGGAALGGGACNCGTGSLVNCTFAWNQGYGGQGGQGGSAGAAPATTFGGRGGDGGSAGGAVANVDGISALTNCTLAFNAGKGGEGGIGGWGFMGYDGLPGRDGDAVGGICNTGTVFLVNTGQVLLVNCILASNSGATGPGGSGFGTPGVAFGNLQGLFNDLGHNLSSDASVQLTGAGSLLGVDPKLGPLADNGGPTWTLALLPSSPAIGAADSASAPSTDQRGFPRPSGSADIGAYEFGYPPSLVAAQSPDGGVDLSVSGRANQVCRLLASPDLVNWTAIATSSFGSIGFFLFHDPAGAGQTQKFYRAVMP